MIKSTDLGYTHSKIMNAHLRAIAGHHPSRQIDDLIYFPSMVQMIITAGVVYPYWNIVRVNVNVAVMLLTRR